MLKLLRYEVVFVQPARTIKGLVEFQLGHTAITGENGKGKSLILELSQFAYWGTKALRGVATDYKKIEVYQVFEVNGIEYLIERSKTNATLSQNGTPLASGTTAVNKKIGEIFGYGFDVFQVANACNQGKLNQLSKMLPTERKKLVDKTIGLDILDDLTKFIAAKESALKSQIDGVQSFLTPPVAVEKPVGYVESSQVKSKLETLRVLQQEYDRLKAQADMVVQFPTEPEAHPRAGELAELKEKQALRNSFASQIRMLQGQISGISDASMTIEEVETHEAYLKDYTQWLNTETSAYTSKYDLWAASIALKARLEKAQVKHDCPKCEHTWYDADPRLAELKDLPTSMTSPAEYVLKLKSERAAPTLAQAQLNIQREAIAKANIKQESQQLLATVAAGFEAIPDDTLTIYQVEVYLNALTNYRVQLVSAQANQDRKHKAFTELSAPRFSELSEISKLSADLLSFTVYEAQMTTYKAALEKYEAHVATAALWRAEADQWGASKKAIVALRERVKGYLMPSLNKVASTLINSMTGGVLSWITVTDDFENITVEGQKLETLSGAGESVANLAIRIALGQVLTNKVYSSISLDEIDGDCDAKRSKFIAECLQRLTSQVKQIIQVSHKDIEAEHYVTL